MTLLEESDFVAKVSTLDVTLGKVYKVKKHNGKYYFKDDDHYDREWSEERFLRSFQKEALSPDEVFRNALLQL